MNVFSLLLCGLQLVDFGLTASIVGSEEILPAETCGDFLSDYFYSKARRSCGNSCQMNRRMVSSCKFKGYHDSKSINQLCTGVCDFEQCCEDKFIDGEHNGNNTLPEINITDPYRFATPSSVPYSPEVYKSHGANYYCLYDVEANAYIAYNQLSSNPQRRGCILDSMTICKLYSTLETCRVSLLTEAFTPMEGAEYYPNNLGYSFETQSLLGEVLELTDKGTTPVICFKVFSESSQYNSSFVISTIDLNQTTFCLGNITTNKCLTYSNVTNCIDDLAFVGFNSTFKPCANSDMVNEESWCFQSRSLLSKFQ